MKIKILIMSIPNDNIRVIEPRLNIAKEINMNEPLGRGEFSQRKEHE